MEKKKIALREKIAGSARPPARFERVYRTAFEFLENPRKLWRSSLFEHRRAVLRMAFETHLRYDRNQGYRTPKTTLPFKVLASLNDLKRRDGAQGRSKGFPTDKSICISSSHSFQCDR